MSKYLLEIGTEELPYKFIPQAIEQLKINFEKFFLDNKIKFNSIKIFATPRRLAVIVNDLAEKQPDIEKIIKGPIKNAAYDENGKLSKAGVGFANKCGVKENDLFLKDNYLHAKIYSKGILTFELIQENVSQIVLKLQGNNFMRWANFDEKFSRPIRWIVSLLDDKEIPVQIVDVTSSKFTRGHRFSEQNIEINNADEYIEKLKKAKVIVNQDERKNLIIQSSKNEADKLDAKVYYDKDLLDEVTYLCEFPIPCMCEFDKKYLNIPQKVTVTVMAKHQRYFPIYKDGKLSNKFITVTNYLGNDFSNIKAGNERVVTARLEDAIFFFNEDTKKPFESYVENLKGVTFQKGMGSVWDKTQRIIALSKIISENLGCSIQQKKSIERTALLCKADLTTNLVFEFTELQGFIGADYARYSKEDETVCKGIEEHYFPLGADEVLATGIEGQVVGIADKLDTICAVFAGGKIPTGSSDPLGIRRAALGIIKTLYTGKLISLNISLSGLIQKTLELLPIKSDIYDKIEEFLKQRFIIWLSDSTKDNFTRKDVLEACLKNTNSFNNFHDLINRISLLREKIKTPEFVPVFESANRISRIVKDSIEHNVKPELFVFDEEKNLMKKIQEIDMNKLNNKEYNYLFDKLVDINPVIEKFFEKVLVMDKDEQIKENRLAILTMLKKKYDLIADFSSLQM